ncbi:MAG: type II toxin-antitoxin system VapC family toxin [Acidimicrobiales bacterium]
MIVVDASVLVPALIDDGPDGDDARRRIIGESVLVPQLIDVEVASAFGKLFRRGALLARRADRALDDLLALPLRRVPHRPLLPRCWGLRDNLSIYDACYVALAEMAGATLVTSDTRLSNATGIRCRVELVGGAN